MITNWIVLDIATAPLSNAADYLDASTIKAPSNWKDETKIAEYVAGKFQGLVDDAALDPDLAQITGIALLSPEQADPAVIVTDGRITEADLLRHLQRALTVPTVVCWNGLAFDVPMILRRGRYLGIDLPHLSTDRYKSPVLDLSEVLSDRSPQRRRSLGFYAKRLGWTDLTKTLSGAEEAQVLTSGRWDDLCVSLRHDVVTTARLAHWLGYLDLPETLRHG
jgi:hypothetical protein